MCQHFPGLVEAAERVLGRSQAIHESCRLRIGNAVLPATIHSMDRRAAERKEVGKGKTPRVQIRIAGRRLRTIVQFIIAMVTYAINEQMARRVEYLPEEMRVLKESLAGATGKSRIAFTPEQGREDA